MKTNHKSKSKNNGPRTVVFGGSGFLGSHVADALTEVGHQVTIYDRVKSSYLQESQKIIFGDILEEDKVEAAVKGADYVYNFAGIADIDEASQKPVESVKYNILGNTYILEACRKAKVKRFIFASSLYVYSKAGSFYKNTKQACELIIESYLERFALPYTILRYGSLYGPRSDERNFIYRVISQAIKERRIVRDGDGEEIREYTHVHDAAKMSVEILSQEFSNQRVIIAGNQQMKVKDLLIMIKEMLDNKIEIKYRTAANNHHYEITPYTFAPKVAKRIVSKTYLDLGQGMLELLNAMHAQTHHQK